MMDPLQLLDAGVTAALAASLLLLVRHLVDKLSLLIEKVALVVAANTEALTKLGVLSDRNCDELAAHDRRAEGIEATVIRVDGATGRIEGTTQRIESKLDRALGARGARKPSGS